MLPGTAAFGLVFGALCAQKHFTLAEVEVMMAIVYGGPMVVVGGVVVIVAIAAAMTVTIIRRNDFVAVIVGMAVAALARALGFSG